MVVTVEVVVDGNGVGVGRELGLVVLAVLVGTLVAVLVVIVAMLAVLALVAAVLVRRRSDEKRTKRVGSMGPCHDSLRRCKRGRGCPRGFLLVTNVLLRVYCFVHTWNVFCFVCL